MTIDPAQRPIVLVIDDEPSTLNLLIDALEPAGFNVLVALQGEMALVLLDQITPDVILLDAMMPGIDGFETCRRIKSRPALGLVPVIFMTGLTETTRIVEGLQAGGVDYITKPVAPNEVVARIKVHVANAQLTRSAQRAMDVSGRFLLAANAAGQLLWCTQQAGKLLGVSASGGMLPPEIVRWLKARILKREPAMDTISIRLSSAADEISTERSKQAEFALIGQLANEEYLIRIIDLDVDQEVERLLSRMPLTRRETEVLLWLARGKSNRDIAQILNVSYRTIDKHLEQIYPKLGVETRTSAVAMTIRVLEGG